MSHTPGPWTWNEDTDGLGFVQGPTHDCGHYFNPADAALIAAAPDLLAALEFYAEQDNYFAPHRRKAGQPNLIGEDLGRKAQAAIAKAKS